jgi:hypothetical protein
LQRLTELRWTEAHNVHLEVRRGAGDDEKYRQYATELVGERARARKSTLDLPAAPGRAYEGANDTHPDCA